MLKSVLEVNVPRIFTKTVITYNFIVGFRAVSSLHKSHSHEVFMILVPNTYNELEKDEGTFICSCHAIYISVNSSWVTYPLLEKALVSSWQLHLGKWYKENIKYSTKNKRSLEPDSCTCVFIIVRSSDLRNMNEYKAARLNSGYFR